MVKSTSYPLSTPIRWLPMPVTPASWEHTPQSGLREYPYTHAHTERLMHININKKINL